MTPKRNWSALLVSNVLLTIPVIFSATVLGYLSSDLLYGFLETGQNRYLFPEFIQQPQNIRGLCVAAAIPAGFLIAQICFVVRVLRPDDFAPARFFHFRLSTCVMLTCAAAGLLYWNVTEVPLVVQATFTRVRMGWPFPYCIVETWAGSPPDATWWHSNLIGNAVFCLDLLLIFMVVLEFCFTRRERISVPPANRLNASASSLPAGPSSPQLDLRPNSDTNVLA